MRHGGVGRGADDDKHEAVSWKTIFHPPLYLSTRACVNKFLFQKARELKEMCVLYVINMEMKKKPRYILLALKANVFLMARSSFSIIIEIDDSLFN